MGNCALWHAEWSAQAKLKGTWPISCIVARKAHKLLTTKQLLSCYGRQAPQHVPVGIDHYRLQIWLFRYIFLINAVRCFWKRLLIVRTQFSKSQRCCETSVSLAISCPADWAREEQPKRLASYLWHRRLSLPDCRFCCGQKRDRIPLWGRLGAAENPTCNWVVRRVKLRPDSRLWIADYTREGRRLPILDGLNRSNVTFKSYSWGNWWELALQVNSRKNVKPQASI